jgi:light-harvesting complex I chlorophyll a/b binding protein 1
MLAVMGYITQEFVRLPGYIAPGDGLKFADVPNGVAAFGSIPFLGWVQLIAFVGFLETAVFKQDPAKEPGDFGTGYYTEFGRVGKLSGDKKAEKLTKELQNGRLAMLAIMELLTHDVAKPAGEGLFTIHHF